MKFYLKLLLLISNICVAQTQITLPSGYSLTPETFSKFDYGKSSYNIYYNLKFSPNPKMIERKAEIQFVLQTNGKVSKFFDPILLKQDSLTEKYTKLSSLGSAEINSLMHLKSRTEKVIIKNFIDNTVIVQNKYRKKYQYEESLPKIAWNLEDDSKMILGYKCKKATSTFRGRDYIAWFAPEIVLNDGPDLFNGLPGLILEISDKENNFHFEAVAIDNKERLIYLRNEDNIIKLNRQKYRDLQRNYFENPSLFHGKAMNEDGSQIKSSPIPYNPLELE
ncbi:MULTISPECIES: GLPGLI family protein [Chryseobacterium]|uniref:GLPGLI family protein n=1 Tax=Chryseobacterium TaxID=59732 RepID=UPI00195AC6B4|nr:MULTISPECIES: GLPGLI family protein [Chryseobacterium]MBM7417767.1 GLPGLI family protein [Chryseobacterium sp. JUb44]MDH6211960.1 GLPGLI family protein [Chryseobacterium sp. BIGb0186]WSO10592.1 GLPGLI family protein [Chryseobacterium scophthalmum]